MSKARIAAAAGAAAIAIAAPVVMLWEGLERDPYRDIVGVVTVCYGHTGNVQNRRYSVEECKALLAKDLAKHEQGIRHCLPANLPVEVRAAFVSTAYNIGTGAFCSSSMSRHARAGNLPAACASLSRWNKVCPNGKCREVRGLTRRRADERKLCESGL